MSQTRVRYAPSPTGIPHIGNIRTALYNFLFAKSAGGAFILRIEDTDRKRLIPSSKEAIKKSLLALNLEWDEYYQQSKRLELYQKHSTFLKDKKLVYEDEGSWRFKIPKGKTLRWQDLVHGEIEFSSNVLEDFVIVKSDGFPTYHFASVIDDHDMQISHVIRGDEWISSTPKHLLLYQSFNWQSPQFVHIPPILGPNKKKLSKREGARSVLDYIKDGYLPQALVNFLALLGWMPAGEQELFSLDELIKEFSLNRLNKNSPIFNLEKLNWFNMQWMKKVEDVQLAQQIKKHFPHYDLKKIKSLVPLVRERMKTLLEFPKIADFFFNPPKISDIPKVSVSSALIANITSVFEKSKNWNTSVIKKLIEDAAVSQKIDRVELIAAIRNIVSGAIITPPLYESLEQLGKEETILRLKNYVKKK
jgi:glutamyl-tRNA synthetase